MTCLGIFLTLAGLACLPLLVFRRIGYGTSLLCSSSGVLFLSSLLAPLVQLLPALPYFFGIGMIVLGGAGTAGAAIYASSGKNGVRERLLHPALPVFLMIGVVCAFWSRRPLSEGICLLAENAIVSLGGEPISFALPFCCASLAALSDEISKRCCAVLFAAGAFYAFGANTLRSYELTSALGCLWCTSALLMLCGKKENKTPLMLFSPSLLLMGGFCGFCAIVSLFLLFILLRKHLPEKRPMILGLFALPMLPLSRLANEGISGFSEKVSQFFTCFGRWRIQQNWTMNQEQGVSQLPSLFHSLLIWSLILLIPLLLSFFFISKHARLKSLQTMSFFGLFTLICPGLFVLRLAIPGELFTSQALAVPITACLISSLFVLLHAVRKWDRSAAAIGCAVLLLVSIGIGCPPEKRFRDYHFIDPASIEKAEEAQMVSPSVMNPFDYPSDVLPASSPLPLPSPATVIPTATPSLVLWIETPSEPVPTEDMQPENGNNHFNG